MERRLKEYMVVDDTHPIWKELKKAKMGYCIETMLDHCASEGWELKFVISTPHGTNTIYIFEKERI